METVTKRLYEALFLIDSAEAAADWQGINEHLKKVLERNEAQIVSMRKWDERPLAYPIMGKKRGTYIIIYFNADSAKLASIENDIRLSERILRVLILRGDHITKEDMEKDTPFQMAEKGIAKPAVAEVAAPEAVVEDEADEIPDINAK